MEQQYKIENNGSFVLKHIFECGQCFRWNEELDGSYTGVFQNNVLNVKEQNHQIIFDGICDGDIKEIVTKYFDLDRDYDDIKNSCPDIKYTYLNLNRYKNMNLIVDLRFYNEYKYLKEYCDKKGYEFSFVFCDYHSDTYQDFKPHASARLANFLKEIGYADGDEIKDDDMQIYIESMDALIK